METAISVNKLFVCYETRHKRSLLNILSKRGKKMRYVVALKKVSFEIPEGEIVGIIGSNGSGKSTLLRTLAKLIAPNMGSVNLHGHTVSLLSLGTGFIGDLSGRDNIFLSGLSMGFTKKEILRKYDSIVEFSELGEAIERPVKTYSSGMYSKLAFSIAVTLDTEILLIDEILSVGDAHFRQKSRRVLEQIIKDKKRTVIIVSHNLGEIKRLCTQVIWLENGKITASGDTDEVLEKYHAYVAQDPRNISYLDPPTLTVKSAPDHIKLTWNKVENAEDYRIYRKETLPGARWSTIANGYTDLSYIDIPPSDEIAYLYTIRARTTNVSGDVWSEFNPGVQGKLE